MKISIFIIITIAIGLIHFTDSKFNRKTKLKCLCLKEESALNAANANRADAFDEYKAAVENKLQAQLDKAKNDFIKQKYWKLYESFKAEAEKLQSEYDQCRQKEVKATEDFTKC